MRRSLGRRTRPHPRWDRAHRLPPRVVGVVTALLVLGRAAFAQTLPSIDVRTWRPSTDPRSSLVLEPVTTPGAWQWNIGASLEYAHDPVGLRVGPDAPITSHPLGHQLAADLVAGIGLGDRASVGLDVPFFLWQDGAASTPNVVQGGAVPTSGIGDVALLAKATLLSNDRKGVNVGPGLAAVSEVTLPTGDRTSFSGEGAVTASLQALGEYALGAAAVRTSLGYVLRPERRTWPAAPFAGTTFGDSVTWAIGFMLRPKALFPIVDDGDRQIWELAAHGALPAGPVAPFGTGASALSPVLLAVDDRIGLGHYRDTYVLLGTEFGLNEAVGVPIVRGVISLGWAPRNHDRDGDGVEDDKDQCPDLPEDRDGIQDEDGCPEDDADGDGIMDEQDACPLVAGEASSDPKKNGCPGAEHHEAPGAPAVLPDGGAGK